MYSHQQLACVLIFRVATTEVEGFNEDLLKEARKD